MDRRLFILLPVVLVMLAAGCSSKRKAPIVQVDLPRANGPVAVSNDEATSKALSLAYDAALPGDTVVGLVQGLATEHPKSAGVQEALGLAWERMGEDQKAIDAYRKALALEPTRPTCWLRLGILLKRNGRDLDGSIAAFRKALETGAPRPRTLNEMGVAYAYKGQLDMALGVWNEAIREDPEWGVLYSNAVKVSLNLDRPDLAKGFYERSKTIAHPEENATLQWGEYLAESGEVDEAVKVYDAAVAQFPDSARVAYYHAQALQKAGKRDEAREEYHRAIRLDPDGPKGKVATWSNRALFIVNYPKEEKQFQKYIQEYFKAIPSPVEKQQETMQELQPKVQALVEARPEFWNAWWLLGCIDRRLRQYGDAHDALDRELEIYPDEPNGIHEMGLLLREEGRLDEAHKYLLKAYDLAPREPAVLMNLTLTEIDLGQWGRVKGRLETIEDRYGEEAAGPIRDYYLARRSGKEPRPGERPEVPIGKFQ